MSTTTEDTNSAKVMSALSAITSLASSLLPNVIDVQQLNTLIHSLIRLPSLEDPLPGVVTTPVINESVAVDQRQIRREKHRQTERVRHNTIIQLIRQLSQMISIQERHETQANVLNRSARYVLFLSHVIDKLVVDSNDDTIDILSEEWLQSLYPLYERAFEEATDLLQGSYDENNLVSQSSLVSSDALNRSRDHCFPLISMALKK